MMVKMNRLSHLFKTNTYVNVLLVKWIGFTCIYIYALQIITELGCISLNTLKIVMQWMESGQSLCFKWQIPIPYFFCKVQLQVFCMESSTPFNEGGNLNFCIKCIILLALFQILLGRLYCSCLQKYLLLRKKKQYKILKILIFLLWKVIIIVRALFSC